VIVVGFVGAPGREGDLAMEVARRAAATGARVEMVGAAAPDGGGDQNLLELAKAGIGHATVIRSGAGRLEAADLDLALRYLPDIHAIVLVGPDGDLVGPASAAAAWSGAGLIIVADGETAPEAGVAPEAIVIEPPPRDEDATFAGLLAALATRLEAGDDPTTAWRATTLALAVDPLSS
jgi:hypothetical protein